MGYYTLAHDNDLDWVLSITSLRKLILHNCMIASWMCIDHENVVQWKPRMHDWTKMEGKRGRGYYAEAFAYGGRWNQFLDRIAAQLLGLVVFRFGYGTSYAEAPETPYRVTYRDGCPVEIFHQRYICFDNGILPTHWPEPREPRQGELHSWVDGGFPNVHKESLEADQKSLDALLRTIRSRK